MAELATAAAGPRAPLVFGMRRGRLRMWSWLITGLLVWSLVLVAGLVGVLLGAAVVWCGLRNHPPRFGTLIVAPQELPQLLWIDAHRIVLGRPWRVVYTDELRPADMAHLRRLCLGLPE